MCIQIGVMVTRRHTDEANEFTLMSTDEANEFTLMSVHLDIRDT